jgi:hypothetical protein
MSDREVQDITKQLQGLQIQQRNTLISRLARLSESRAPLNEPPRAVSPALRSTREFSVGDKVRIRNPRALQETRGTITRRIGVRVTVTTAKGNMIVRAAKNLILDNII